MFEEKTIKEAVCAYLDNIQVYVKTEGEDEALLPISCFKLEDLRNEEYRYIVDMPDVKTERKKKSNAKKEKILNAETGAEDFEEVYIPETVKRTSVVTGAEVVVDVKKARALRKAGWSMEKTADEFNISVRDMEAILDEQK